MADTVTVEVELLESALFVGAPRGSLLQHFQPVATTLNPTTTSTTFVGLSEMSQAITPAAATNLIRVAFTGSFSNSNANVYNAVAVFIDAVEQPRTERRQQAGGVNDRVTIAVERWFSLSAAAHTIEIRWRVEGNTGTADDDDRILIVQEYAQQ